MRFIVFAAVASIGFSTQSSAQGCTNEQIQQKTDALFIYVQDHPEKAGKMARHKAEVEAEYGGKPSEAELCEALDKIQARLEADK
ncbi:hypothetical protein [Roseovarius aestuarii]|uniref:Uncharacterized protein n=1 Tax=Roseovarius aestuarii TaxID=475083 RepID=A0A1X7BTB0_9RHOB|nr:hypothetical protein [Roseovarius aestuarii]SMC12842.1 hypothetical protein ROA7745_02674 [Roseovarius aestuarii]